MYKEKIKPKLAIEIEKIKASRFFFLIFDRKRNFLLKIKQTQVHRKCTMEKLKHQDQPIEFLY